ncbi:hypothetical protein [Reyranella sp.]|uniref:hypothetical protein n=1 Tax=Reyranella sp. TaxID=1929291 RepID=UPI003C7B4233
MRSNKPVNMDIDQLRGWASIMDKAMIGSLVATVLAVSALGITTFLSFRYSGAVRAHEQAALERYQGLESQAAQQEREASAAREKLATLEREIASAQGRTAMLEQEVAAAREQAATLAQQADRARERAAAFEQAAREATERAARAPRESAAAPETARAPLFDAAEIRRRLADLGKLVRDATTRAPEAVPGRSPATESASASPPSMAPPPPPPSPFVASLQRYAGTKAALFLLGQISDAPAIGATISADLGQAGWLPETWTWGGVAGIFGVVVLVRDGSDPATHEAAAALVDALGAAGFSASKGEWPANWGRFRGTLNGPQTPSPTDAAIRIVVGEKARKAS